ncbi:MAG: peptidase [Steroidobacteraceae bacterium]
MKKLLILIHRYVGIAISLLMVLWCLSGFVMMYVGYPQLDEQERVAGLATLDLEGCCDSGRILENMGDVPVRAFAVEMLAGQPVVRMSAGVGFPILSLRSGDFIDHISEADALAVVSDYMRARSISGEPKRLASVNSDQWTISSEYDADRPLYKVALGDPAGTQVYVSSASGVVVLDTTARERTWNWFGAVTHWLYPVLLRQHAVAWSQVVIWTAVVGAFLSLIGLWLGIMQIRAGRTGALSPYKGWNLWHHMSGLVFGVLLLAWVGSGLLSMNPWGLLESRSGRAESERLRGVAFSGQDVVAAIARLAAEAGKHPGTRRIESASFAGRQYLTLRTPGGAPRLDAVTLAPVPLSEADLAAAAPLLQPEAAIASSELLTESDAYYYDDHDGRRTYPVYRVILADPERTRYYIDPLDGRLLQKTDRAGRWYRWLFQALHRWDFVPVLNRRPLWDLVVLTLLLGVTAVSLTGLYLGFRRLKPR